MKTETKSVPEVLTLAQSTSIATRLLVLRSLSSEALLAKEDAFDGGASDRSDSPALRSAFGEGGSDPSDAVQSKPVKPSQT